MRRLIVGNVDGDLVRRLKDRAARNGRSAEAEHRAILENALRPESSDFWTRADQLRRDTEDSGLCDSTAILRRIRASRVRRCG